MALSQDLKEAAFFVADLGSGIGNSLEDGKITVSDAFNFKEALQSAIPAFSGIQNVKFEELDTPENREELKNLFKDRFDLNDDEAERKVEKVVNAVIVIIDLVLEFKP